MNSPGFHQVFKFHQVFTKKNKMVNSPGFHPVFTRLSPGFQIFYQVFTKKNLVNSPGFHQVFARFSPGFQISPSFQKKIGESTRFFHQVFFHQVLELHQVFTKFSPGFQVFYQAWAINQEVSESHQVFTAVMVDM